MKLPTIGELSRRLRLEVPVRTPDGGGGAETAWQVSGEVWAALRAIAGTESVRAEALEGRVTHEIWVRHRPEVVPRARFVEGARIFDIRAALDPDGRQRWLRCLCEERVG